MPGIVCIVVICTVAVVLVLAKMFQEEQKRIELLRAKVKPSTEVQDDVHRHSSPAPAPAPAPDPA